MMKLLRLIYIENNINDKVVEVENQVTQGAKSLSRKLKLNK